MIHNLFETVNELLDQSYWVILLTSFFWGVLSVLLSPCHLTSIPLIIGFVDDAGARKVRSRFALSVLFSCGMLISVAFIGFLTASLGRIAGDIGAWGNWLGAIIFALIGFHFLEIIPISFRGISSVPLKKKGNFAAFIIGLLFGVALGPCTFAFLAPVLAVTFAKEDMTILANASVLIMYGVGNSILVVLAGTFTASLQKYLNWTQEHNFSESIKKICGVLLLAGSLYFVWKAI
jgi:cytochrome c-type biogenesis protein